MKALVFVDDMFFELREVERPQCQTKEALIKVEYSGICGSDMHAWHGHDERRRPPLILGHEVSGVVVEGALEGRRVALNPMITCGVCRYCRESRENLCADRSMIGMYRPGGFSEYLTIPEQCVLPFHDSLKTENAALAEPTAVCLHAVKMIEQLSYRKLEEQNVLIIGGGAIGILCALILKHFSASSVTISEINPERLKNCINIGGVMINNPLEEEINSTSYDCVIDAVGTQKTRTVAINSVVNGGCIIHLGLQEAGGEMDARSMTLREIAFAGAFTYTKQEVKDALELLAFADLGDFNWVEKAPLAQGQEAFESIHRAETPSAKILLTP